ncbi:MAG: fibronectin type III domain-containing protein [Nitrospiraceae bacterium]|nr:MAG: fibronectin type III domain-containing protein [Nitrospiraceae bacterium]
MRKEATYKSWFITLMICLAVVLNGNIVFAASTVLSWTAPTTNADDTPLTDLGGFNIYYGTAPGSYSQSIDAGNVTTYQVDNLSTGVTYYFVTTAYDTSGNESGYSNETSKTIPVPDTTPPAISSVQSGDITYSSASIAWTTDEASDTQVQYGTTTSYGSTTTLDSSMLTSHTQHLTNLLPATLYHFKVLSRDASGNLAISGDYTFITSAPPDIMPPSTPVGLRAD